MEKSVEEGNKGNNQNYHLVAYLKEAMNLPDNDIRTFSPLTLAYIGDGIYDLIIRTMVVKRGNAPVNKLHKVVSGMVKASAQMKIFHVIEECLSAEELTVYKRGRNAKSFTTAKNASMSDYRTATGFEALIGYLYLEDDMNRIMELINIGLEKVDFNE